MKGRCELNHRVKNLEAAIEALDALGLKYKRQSNGIVCQCPVHQDEEASCSISAGTRIEQSVVVKCFAGCDWRDVKEALESALGNRGAVWSTRSALSTTVSPTRPAAMQKAKVDHGRPVEQARYHFRFEDGTVAFTKVRLAYPHSPQPGRKSFFYSRDDGARLKQLKADGAVPVYNLPDLKRRIEIGEDAWAGEGEKDCETAKKHGRTMICGHAGASQQLPGEYAEQLRGLRLLTIVPDVDGPGTKHALNWVALARKAGIPFRVMRTPLETKGADLTDHFDSGLEWDDLLDVTDEFLGLENPDKPEIPKSEPRAEVMTLAECDMTYQKWMSKAYDLAVVHANLAVRAAHELEGEPVWLLTVAGSASGKTEGIAPLAATPNTVMVSEVASPGALLSGTSNSERSKDATGGLLNQMGPQGTMILKDFTSILSLSSDARTAVLAAFREIYDGSWTRHVGTDGGKKLSWTGRISLLGATTTTYDRHHSVIAAMGDRFALIRMSSRDDRRTKGAQALMNTGHEKQMRHELSRAVAGVIAGMDKNPEALDEEELMVLFEAADFVTLARTPAERDFKGEPIEANDPESPTRFVKMLQQIVLGGSAIGMRRRDAMLLALRVAHDSVPPVRRKVLQAVHQKPFSATVDVVEATQFHRTTTDRMLQELALQGLLWKSQGLRHDGTEGGRWRYNLAEGIDPNAVTPEALPPENARDMLEVEAASAPGTFVSGASIRTSPAATGTSAALSIVGPDSASEDGPDAFDMPKPSEVRLLAPSQDIEAETCDDHLVASQASIRGCVACRSLRRAAAA